VSLLLWYQSGFIACRWLHVVPLTCCDIVFSKWRRLWHTHSVSVCLSVCLSANTIIPTILDGFGSIFCIDRPPWFFSRLRCYISSVLTYLLTMGWEKSIRFWASRRLSQWRYNFGSLCSYGLAHHCQIWRDMASQWCEGFCGSEPPQALGTTQMGLLCRRSNAPFTLPDLSATKSDRQIDPKCRPEKNLLANGWQIGVNRRGFFYEFVRMSADFFCVQRHVGRRFLCQPPKLLLGPTCLSDFVADKSQQCEQLVIWLKKNDTVKALSKWIETSVFTKLTVVCVSSLLASICRFRWHDDARSRWRWRGGPCWARPLRRWPRSRIGRDAAAAWNDAAGRWRRCWGRGWRRTERPSRWPAWRTRTRWTWTPPPARPAGTPEAILPRRHRPSLQTAPRHYQCLSWGGTRRKEVSLLLNAVSALLADTAFFLRSSVKFVAARCDFRAQNTPKCVCGRGFALEPTGSLQRSPKPHICFLRGALPHGRGREKRGWEGWEEWERGGKGSVPHFFFLQFNHWSLSSLTRWLQLQFDGRSTSIRLLM